MPDSPPRAHDETASNDSTNVVERLKHGRHADRPGWVHGIAAGLSLYMFLSAINVIGSGLKTVGKNSDWLERLLAHGDNPFVALMGSILVTAVVQSSSFTTALIITLTASDLMDVETAVFAIMGANIGTSVTNTIVALGQVRIRRQFRRAFSAALVHDMFNWLTVGVLFPIEWVSGAMHSSGKGWLMRGSEWGAGFLSASEIGKPFNPIKWLTHPIVWVFKWFGNLFTNNPVAGGIVIAVIGLVLLFVSLMFLVKNLKGALLSRIEGLFRTFFFRNDAVAYCVGVITTVLVQSSSVTTSLIVPLAGAGAVKLKRVFPYTLGANLGTTVTGVLAATANPVPAAVTVAIAHVAFNLIGTAVWYPLRVVPLSLARECGNIAARSKRYAFLFLLTMFVVIPIIGLVITEIFTR